MTRGYEIKRSMMSFSLEKPFYLPISKFIFQACTCLVRPEPDISSDPHQRHLHRTLDGHAQQLDGIFY